MTKSKRSRRRQWGFVRRLPSGRYQASYLHLGRRWFPDNGSFPTKADANAWLAKKQVELDTAAWMDPTAGAITVNELVAKWFASNPNKAKTTLALEKDAVRLYIEPVIGTKAINTVTQPDIQGLVNLMVEKGLAPKTISRTYGIVRTFFAYAVNADWLVRSPCRNINLPQVVARKRQPITPEELAALAEGVGEEYAPMLYLGAMGLRWSEVAGLKVGALSLLAGTLTVEEALVRAANNEKVTKRPKSHHTRSLTLPDQLVEMLAHRLNTIGLNASNPDAYVFTDNHGGPLDYSAWRRGVWVPARTKVGRPDIGFHDLRRMAATALVVTNVDMATAQARLGHADAEMTLGLYAQATGEGDREAARRLGEYLMPKEWAVRRLSEQTCRLPG